MYQECCGSNDQIYNDQMEGLCSQLLQQSGNGGNPARTARVLRVTTEGVWLDMMTMNSPYERAEALATVYCCVQALFPKHFNADGLIG